MTTDKLAGANESGTAQHPASRQGRGPESGIRAEERATIPATQEERATETGMIHLKRPAGSYLS